MKWIFAISLVVLAGTVFYILFRLFREKGFSGGMSKADAKKAREEIEKEAKAKQKEDKTKADKLRERIRKWLKWSQDK
jgi:hypothetical protein